MKTMSTEFNEKLGRTNPFEMNSRTMPRKLLLIAGVLWAISASGMDYVELKNGKLIEGAILRQDTIAVFMTTWEMRAEQFPPLQVFARDEIKAIWFEKPSFNRSSHSAYRPLSRQLELGGGMTFQTWQASNQDRRNLLQLSVFGGVSITPVLGLELDADLTYPFGDEDTPAWDNLDFSHQVSMNLLAHYPTKRKIVPYVLVGGGSAEGVPVAGVLLTDAAEIRSMVHAGLGFKYGFDGLGFRVELRHAYYIWEETRLELNPNNVDESLFRKLTLDADATVLRFTLFGYL
jgi:hypothetical protein